MFGMLETIREYAVERLEASGEIEQVRLRHAHYFADLSITAAAELHGPHQKAWFERLESEMDNLRAGLEWLLVTGPCEIGVEMATALSWFWYVGGYFSEGRGWLAQALVQTGENSTAKPRLLIGAGIIARDQGDLVFAGTALPEAVELSHKVRRPAHGSLATDALGVITALQGRLDEAQNLFEQSLCLFERSGNRTRAGESYVRTSPSPFATKVTRNKQPWPLSGRSKQNSRSRMPTARRSSWRTPVNF